MQKALSNTDNLKTHVLSIDWILGISITPDHGRRESNGN